MKRAILVILVVGLVGCSQYGDPTPHYYKGTRVTCQHCGYDLVERKKVSYWTGIVGSAMIKEYRCGKCSKKVSMRGRVEKKVVEE